MTTIAYRWYVIVAGKDLADALPGRLKASGFDVFWPKRRVLIHRLRTRVKPAYTESAWLPVFGRYVFVGLPDGNEPGDLIQVRGVNHLLNDADGKPGIIPAEYIDWARHKYRDYRRALKMEEFPIKPGTKVRIMAGPLIGYEATLLCVNMSKYIGAMVREAMGREVRFELGLDDFVPV